MQRTMAWRFEGRLAIVVHGPKNPSNLEWQSMLRDESAMRHLESARTLIVSYGGGPDGHQRQLLAQQIATKPVPTCILTKSPMVRAITAALLFFNRTMKVFGLHEQERAYEFLELSPQEREAAARVRRELERELGLDTSFLVDDRL
jgi:hypothetical protein